MKLSVQLVILLLMFFQPSKAEILVNEVLANEPGRTTSLEWIELYNNSSSSVSLGDYQLQINDNFIILPDSVIIEANGFYIVCRKLYATVSSPGFESFWGDSSGLWGDTPAEKSLITPLEATFSLINNSGSVVLLNNGREVSMLTWIESGLDGHSWERVLPDESTVQQSIDANGSTPGYINSVTPVPFDLSLNNVIVENRNTATYITVKIVNTGLNSVMNVVVYLIHYDEDSFPLVDDTIGIVVVPELYPGDTTEIIGQYILDGMYLSMKAVLSDDDRINNNTYEFIAPGSSYPPVILTELLANPQNGLSTEWLEIKNRSEQPVDLSGWRFGDTNNLWAITQDSFFIASDERLVLAQSVEDFSTFYPAFNNRTVQPTQWSVFNNNGDIVRLVDSYGIEADRFEYSTTFDDNYTWCRSEEPQDENQWGRSENIAGTPGEPNRVVFQQNASDLFVIIDPAYISSDGDGFEDNTTITITAPTADNYTVKIYDRQGRVVKTFYDKETYIQSQLQWDGLSDSGKRLPIGIYILFVEAGGVKSIKKPIIIAR